MIKFLINLGITFPTKDVILHIVPILLYCKPYHHIGDKYQEGSSPLVYKARLTL